MYVSNREVLLYPTCGTCVVVKSYCVAVGGPQRLCVIIETVFCFGCFSSCVHDGREAQIRNGQGTGDVGDVTR